MDEQTGNQKKPLRPAPNKKQDIYNTYMKNEKSRNIPIQDLEEELKMNDNNNMNEELENENLVQESNSNEVDISEYVDVINELNKQNETLMSERDDLKEQLIRKAAELENVRRRSIREKQEMIDFANERLLFKMLELLDDITSASNASHNTTDFDSLVKGLDMIQAKAMKLFDEAGVKKMEEEIGSQFDVNFHEALMMSPSELPEGAIVQYIQPGYMIKEKVLRHAKVITSAGNQ
jgi:molecular chaperone GrpE